MSHDTPKDPRLRTAQLACLLLNKAVKLRCGVQLRASRQRLAELAASCESDVMALTYLYQKPEELAVCEPMQSLARTAATLCEVYQPLAKAGSTMLRSNIRWSLRTLSGLAGRLRNPGRTFASGVDLVVVHLRHAVREGDFKKTRVTDGRNELTVMTNLMEVEAGSELAAAFLPPSEVGGQISEAMFLGSEKRNEPAGTMLSEDQVDAREAAGILFDLVAKHLH